ncbi:DUF1810 family protein [Methylopila sp. 73B]|uniref:DUF1810 family protein n=1 Tax=Methylopila sp. 73B TaxID=1120792 RepID=UPI0012DE08E4|nr:DUF1810 family protein [Methylopila sp. 73B]
MKRQLSLPVSTMSQCAPDDMKFRSSMTLFEHAAATSALLFATALNELCAGKRGEQTLALLVGDHGISSRGH